MDIAQYVKITKIESGTINIPKPEKFSFPCPTCKNNIDVEKKLKIILRDDLEAVENTLSHAKEKREFCEAVKDKRFDLITYFRRLREITAKYSAMVLIAYIKDNYDFLNERCNKCGLGLIVHYQFSFTPPSIPSPTVLELTALKL
ncbi:MAG: hypothetical protein H3Z54_11400, partial [archaeon]|nr:hypothetical protein [archaeon]